MALIFVEGFDHLSATQVTAKGWSSAMSAMQTGRFDGQSAQITNATFRTKTLPSTYSTIIGGVAFRTTAIGTASAFYQFRSGATTTCQLFIDATGHLQIRNSGGTTIATGTTILAVNTWYYAEVKLVVGTSGTVEVHLGGATEIASTVGNFGTTNIDTIGIAALNIGSSNMQFDDMYGCDTSGSTNTSFLGDIRVETTNPNGAGTHTAWTHNGAASNYLCVDETTPDDDATYVSDATPGDIDTYTFSDIDAAATVYGVQTNLYARKDDANTRQIAPMIRQASTDYVGSTVTLTSTYVVYSQRYDNDPTGSAWTASNVNGDEFGVKEIA